MRLDWAPHRKSARTLLMARLAKRHDLNLVKTLHRFTHAGYEEMERILQDSSNWNDQSKVACGNLMNACPICASKGRPHERRNISITHVTEAFNEELQADFLDVWIQEEKKEIINIMDVGTNTVEREIVSSRSGERSAIHLRRCGSISTARRNNSALR